MLRPGGVLVYDTVTRTTVSRLVHLGGFQPHNDRALVSAVLARRRGQITDADVPGAVRFRLVPGHRPVVTYLGFARKPLV